MFAAYGRSNLAKIGGFSVCSRSVCWSVLPTLAEFGSSRRAPIDGLVSSRGSYEAGVSWGTEENPEEPCRTFP